MATRCDLCGAKYDAFYHKDVCPKCGWDAKGKQYKKTILEQQAEKARELEKERFDRYATNEYNSAIKNVAIDKLRETGANGYYEYSVKTVVDERGRTNVRSLNALLNEMGLAGWHLVASHTNELGVNAVAMLGLGINSTADETVLIFERFVKL